MVSAQSAVDYIKDVFQESEEQPICYDHITYKYTLTEDVRSEANYVEWTARGLRTRMRRFDHHLTAAAAKFPDNRRIKRVRRHADMIAEDLDDLMHDFAEGYEEKMPVP